jgi:hypothetical protein
VLRCEPTGQLVLPRPSTVPSARSFSTKLYEPGRPDAPVPDSSRRFEACVITNYDEIISSRIINGRLVGGRANVSGVTQLRTCDAAVWIVGQRSDHACDGGSSTWPTSGCRRRPLGRRAQSSRRGGLTNAIFEYLDRLLSPAACQRRDSSASTSQTR